MLIFNILFGVLGFLCIGLSAYGLGVVFVKMFEDEEN